MLSLQHSHGYSGSFLNYITMDNRFLDLIERSIKEHWDLPAFSDYNGHTFHFKDVARRIEKFHSYWNMPVSRKATKWPSSDATPPTGQSAFSEYWLTGAVAVPILHEFKPDNIHHIVNHSGAKAVLAGSSNWENMNEKMMPDVKLFMMLDNFSIIDCKNKEVRTIRDRINEYFGKKYPRSFTANDVKYHIEDPEELAVLNYTSGTTSFSKGVMIPYRSLWSNTQFAYDRLPFIHPGDNIVCMLPMAHMYGLAFEVLNSVNKGCHVHFLTRTPSPKIIAEACDGSTGADPCRATHYREDHQEQGLSRTGKAIDQIAVESAIHRPKGTREDRPKAGSLFRWELQRNRDWWCSHQ